MTVQIQDHGSIVLFFPLDEEAADWFEANVANPSVKFGSSWPVEWRYAGDIAEGFVADGGEVVT